MEVMEFGNHIGELHREAWGRNAVLALPSLLLNLSPYSRRTGKGDRQGAECDRAAAALEPRSTHGHDVTFPTTRPAEHRKR